MHEKERTILRHQRKKAEKVYRESVIRNMSDKEASLLDQLKLYDENGMMAGKTARCPRNFDAVAPDIFPPSPEQDIVIGVASKKPKDDKVIIEELQVANSHLRKMVDSLFHELSSCQRENIELKKQIMYLESLHGTPATAASTQRALLLQQSQSAQPSPQHGFRTYKSDSSRPPAPPPPLRSTSTTLQPSSSMTMSVDNSSLSEADTNTLSGGAEVQLPPLPPLEMPTFDFEKKGGEG